jgi:O-methyltransferase
MISDETLLRELSRQYCQIPGDVAELGVYGGDSLYLLAELWSDRVIWGFDTFTGLPTIHAYDGNCHHEGKFAKSYAAVKERFASKPHVRLVPGLFQDTKHVVANRRFAFVHLDCDLYESYRSSLLFFFQRLNGAMLIDDYNCESCPGAKRAVDESRLSITGSARGRIWIAS